MFCLRPCLLTNCKRTWRLASSVSASKYSTFEHQLSTKQEFLAEFSKTSNSLVQSLLYKNISLGLQAHRIDYRIKPSTLSHLLSSEKLQKLLHYLQNHSDQLNTGEKSIIFKIFTIVNKQSADATLSSLLAKIEQDLYANLDACDIVDLNNILEGIQLTRDKIVLRQNIINIAANLISKKFNSNEEPSSLFQKDPSSELVNALNRHWIIGVNDRNDLVFMLAFLEKFRLYFTDDYKVFIEQCIQRNKYLANDLVSTDNYIDMLSVTRYLFMMQKTLLSNGNGDTYQALNKLYKAKLTVRDNNELNAILTSISNPAYELKFIHTIMESSQISSLKYGILDYFSKKIEHTNKIHEVLMYHDCLSKLKIPSIANDILGHRSVLERSKVTLPEITNMFHRESIRTYSDSLIDAKRLIYQKIENSIHEFDITLVSKIFNFNKDYSAMSHELRARILQVVEGTEINFENINHLCKFLLKSKQATRGYQINGTLLDYIARADILKVYNLKRYGDSIQLYFLAKNKLDDNKLQPLVENILLGVHYHNNTKAAILEQILIKNTHQQNKLINKSYNKLIQIIGSPTDWKLDKLHTTLFILQQMMRHENKLNLKLDKKLNLTDLKESIRIFSQMDYSRMSHRKLERYYTDLSIRMKCLSIAIVINNVKKYDRDLLVEHAVLCNKMYSIVEKLTSLGVELSHIDYSFNNIFFHCDVKPIMNSSKDFRFQKANLEKFNTTNYRMLILDSIGNTDQKTLALILYCMSLLNLGITNDLALKELFPQDSSLEKLLVQIQTETENNRRLFEMYVRALYLIISDACKKNKINTKYIPKIVSDSEKTITKPILDYMEEDLLEMFGKDSITKNETRRDSRNFTLNLNLHQNSQDFKIRIYAIDPKNEEETIEIKNDIERDTNIRDMNVYLEQKVLAKVKDRKAYIQDTIKASIQNFFKKNR